MSAVTPSGEIVAANACQNQDLFWGLRGGGGSTLGVMLNFTTKAWPSESLTEYNLVFGSPTNNSEKFGEAMSWMATQFPAIIDGGAMCYGNITPASSTTPTIFYGGFQAPNMTVAQTSALLDPIAKHINATFAPDVIAGTETQEWSSYYDWWINNQDTATPKGADILIGSRILDEKALNHPNFGGLIQQTLGPTGIQMIFAAGPGTHAFPADFNAVLPAWRTGYAHTSSYGPFFYYGRSGKVRKLS